MRHFTKFFLLALVLLALGSAFDQPAGTKLWEFYTGHPIQSSPAIAAETSLRSTGVGWPWSRTQWSPIHTLAARWSKRAPERPAAIITRPQFGSRPVTIVLISGDEAIVRAASRASSSEAAPSAVTSRSAVAPSPSPAMAPEQKVMTAPAESQAAAGGDVTTSATEDATGTRLERQLPLLRSAPAPLAESPAGRSATAPARSAVLAAPEPAELWRDLDTAPPERWIERIVELRRAGKTADADALATEFSRRFPDQRLPMEAR